VASAIFHALLFFVAVLVLALGPDRIEFAHAKPKLQPLEVQLVPPTPAIAQQIFTLKNCSSASSSIRRGSPRRTKRRKIRLSSRMKTCARPANCRRTGTNRCRRSTGARICHFENFKTQDVHLGPKAAPEASDVALASKPVPSPQPPPTPAPPRDLSSSQSQFLWQANSDAAIETCRSSRDPERSPCFPQSRRRRNRSIVFLHLRNTATDQATGQTATVA
jgi:hypothetical protein